MNLQPSNSILAGATVSGDLLVDTQAVNVNAAQQIVEAGLGMLYQNRRVNEIG